MKASNGKNEGFKRVERRLNSIMPVSQFNKNKNEPLDEIDTLVRVFNDIIANLSCKEPYR